MGTKVIDPARRDCRLLQSGILSGPHIRERYEATRYLRSPEAALPCTIRDRHFTVRVATHKRFSSRKPSSTYTIVSTTEIPGCVCSWTAPSLCDRRFRNCCKVAFHPVETHSGNMGATCRRLAAGNNTFEGRFRRLLSCDRVEICERLRPVVLAAKAKGAPVLRGIVHRSSLLGQVILQAVTGVYC